MQLITKFNKRFKFLLCVIGWFISLKDKKVLTITNAFLNILDESNRKPNKIWVDKDSEFFDTWMKLWIEKKWNRNIFNP